MPVSDSPYELLTFGRARFFLRGGIRIKVLVLATSFPRWRNDATPPFVYELCKRLTARGWETVVLAPHHEGAELQEEIEGIRIYRFPYFWPKKYQRLCYQGGILPNLRGNILLWMQVPLLFMSQLFYAVKLIRKERIDIIHSHWLVPSGLVGAICGKICRRPLLVTIHGSDIFPLRRHGLKRVLRMVLNACDACTANSRATASAVQEIMGAQQKLAVIPMGVDLDLFRSDEAGIATDTSPNYDDEKPVILSVGRLINWKGVTYVIQAMPLILAQLPEARLVICGDGPERKNLEELTGQLNLTKSVTFEGNVPNSRLPDYYRTASLFVLPSIVIESTGETEALGVVLLEAMASGTPVIGSKVGGIPDIIEEGRNGFLAEQKNPQDLADKIVRLLSNKELRQRFSRNGMQTVREKFSWEAVVGRFVRAYQQVTR